MRFFALFLSIFLLFPLTSCSKEENDFYYDVATAPLNLDPQSAYDDSSLLLIQNLYEGLTVIEPDGTTALGIAESCLVRDGKLTYIFTLKDDLRWSNGEPLTADDVVFAFRRLLDRATRSPFAGDFFLIENAESYYNGTASAEELGVIARDDKTVAFSLNTPDDNFLRLLSTAAAMPCSEAFFTETRGKYGLTKAMVLGNGAFAISSWQESYISLKKNAEYQSEQPVTADFVRINFLDELASEKTLQQRFLDRTTSAAACSGENLMISPGWTVEEKQNAVWALTFSKNSQVFTPAMRKALAYSCDLSRLEGVLPDRLSAANGFVPTDITVGALAYRQDGTPLRLPYSSQKATEQLAKAMETLDHSALSSVKLILPEGSGGEEYLSYLIQGWQKELRLYLSLEVLPQKEYAARLQSGDFDCALVAFSGDNGPGGLLSALDDPTLCIETPSPAFHDALQQGEKALSDEKKAEYFLSAETLLLNEAVALPLCFETTYFVQGEGVSGLRYSFDTGLVDFKYGKIS